MIQCDLIKVLTCLVVAVSSMCVLIVVTAGLRSSVLHLQDITALWAALNRAVTGQLE